MTLRLEMGGGAEIALNRWWRGSGKLWSWGERSGQDLWAFGDKLIKDKLGSGTGRDRTVWELDPGKLRIRVGTGQHGNWNRKGTLGRSSQFN